jgi:hypothetical protein
VWALMLASAKIKPTANGLGRLDRLASTSRAWIYRYHQADKQDNGCHNSTYPL